MKGFPSQFKIQRKLADYPQFSLKQDYVTIQPISHDRHGLDMVPKMVSVLPAYAAAVAVDGTQPTNDPDRVITIAGHGARVGDVLRFASGTNINIEMAIVEVPDVNTVILAGKLLAAPTAGADTVQVLRYVTLTGDLNGNLAVSAAYLTVVDELDAEFINPSATTIPRSSVNAISIVAALGSTVRKIQVVQDVGEFLAIYSDAARTSKICTLPLTPDESVEVTIAAGTEIFIGAIKDVDVTADSLLLINFLG